MRKAEEAIPTAIYDTEQSDQELQAQYGMEEPRYRPVFLYVERGPGAGQLLEVKQGSLVIGRASVSDLRLQHPSISRRHAQVKRVGEQFFIKDLGSQNGTFVNKQRIANEVECKPGDMLALGNAVVRLRGPLNKGEKVTARPQTGMRRAVQTAVVARPSGQYPAKKSNALKIAIFAGAVGFGLAAVLGVALIKTMVNQPSASKTAKARGASSDSDVAVITEDEKERTIQEAIARTMKKTGADAPAPEPTPEPEAAPEVKPAAPVVVVRAEPVAAKPSPAPAKKVRKSRSAGRSAAANDDDEEEDDSSTGSRGGSDDGRTAILAQYERGNAEGSLDAAKRAGDKALIGKLSQFLSAYDAANEAMLSNNGTKAIVNFQKALKLDNELSSGWGKYGAEIRKQLSNLYTLVGLQHVSNGNDSAARQAFEAAVKHDPRNGRAKDQLAKLGGGGGSKSAASAADDAFDDAPAPKSTKSTAASIDDAFGD